MNQIKYSELYNPYDFSHPVRNRELFIGRNCEMLEIQYYLNQAKNAPRPINIALLGDRASGKTSLLNMIELESQKRGYCVARIDLNESDIETQLAFFFKIFDSLFSACCNFSQKDANGNINYCYGGKQAKTFETYLDMISCYNIPEDKTWCPFIFPIQYAKAIGNGQDNCRISEQGFKDDLEKMYLECNFPVILLFDECNVITKNGVLLQMLRNIFMNISGYMLVFTGTQQLFPIMDEVFSPIVRQFKKINVTKFNKEEDTEECIKKPLESIGLNPTDTFDLDSYEKLKEIHDLTGGRPYEIQLICHFMFKNLQLRNSGKMLLNLDILDEVLQEITRGHDIYSRPIISNIRNLTSKQTFFLNELVACEGYSTFESIWFVRFVISGEESYTRDELYEHFELFKSKGLISESEGIIKFTGDDFDRIYTKYYSVTKKSYLSFPQLTLETFLGVLLNFEFNHSRYLNCIGDIDGHLVHTISKCFEIIESINPNDNFTELNDTYDSYPVSCTEAFYEFMIQMQSENRNEVKILMIFLKTQWINREYIFSIIDNNQFSNIKLLIDDMVKRARSLGEDIEYVIKDIKILDKKQLVDGTINSNNIRLKQSLADIHFCNAVNSYLHEKDIDKAIESADLSNKYNPNGIPECLNVLGYLNIIKCNNEKAKECLEESIKAFKNSKDACLPKYNIGIIEFKQNNFPEAQYWFLESLELCKGLNQYENFSGALLVPNTKGETIIFEEVSELNLIETIQNILEIIEKLKTKEKIILD